MRVCAGAVLVSASVWLLAAALEQQEQRNLASVLDPAGVVGKISEGLKNAGRVLGLHIADTVADLVSSAFRRPAPRRGDPGPAASHRNKPPLPPHPPPPPQPSVLSGILRLLGLDPGKLGAIALNGVIFLAQLISSSLATRPVMSPHGIRGEDQQSDQLPAGSPLYWVLSNPLIKSSAALQGAQDPRLPDLLVEDIQRRFPRQARALEGDTGCVQLLVCRAAPFVRGMQRSLAAALGRRGDTGAEGEGQGQARLTPVQRMFQHMPSASELLDNATLCAERFPACRVMY